MTMTAPTLVQIDSRKRASLGALARFDQYLVREEADGTIVFEPAVILTSAERAVLADNEFLSAIRNANANPEHRRTRQRRTS